MTRVLPHCLVLAVVFLCAGVCRAQTDKPCRIVVENFSREHFKVKRVAILLPDGSKWDYPTFWSLKPGDRADLVDANGRPLEGRQLFFTVGLPDNVSSTRLST